MVIIGCYLGNSRSQRGSHNYGAVAKWVQFQYLTVCFLVERGSRGHHFFTSKSDHSFARCDSDFNSKSNDR